MVLYVVGLGLGDEQDVTLRGLNVIKKSKKVFLENYTSVLGVELDKLVLTHYPSTNTKIPSQIEQFSPKFDVVAGRILRPRGDPSRPRLRGDRR